MSYDDDLKKRMALAKQQGWSDEEINRSALIDRTLQQQKAQAQQKQTAVKEKPQGAFKANSILGIGTSLLPFGEVLRKKLNGEKVSGGDVALDTALSVIPFGLGKAGKLVKGAKTLATATKAAKAVKPAVKVAEGANKEKSALVNFLKGDPTKGPVAGNLTKAGEGLKAEARGVKPAIKPVGSGEPLYTKGVKEVNDTLNQVPRKTTALGRTKYGTRGSATKQLGQVEAAQQKAGMDIETAISGVKKPFEQTSLQATRDAAIKDIVGENGGGVLEMGAKHNKIVSELDNKLASVKDVRGAVNLKREVAGKIKFNRGTASPDNTAEKVYEIYRRKLDDLINTASPDVKKANTAYSKLETAKGVVVQNTPGNLKQAGNAGPTSRLLNNSVTQTALDKGGRALTRAAKIQASPITKQAEIRAPFSLAGAAGAGQQGELPQDVSELFPGTQDPNEATMNQLAAAGITDPQQMFDALSGQGDYAPQTETATDATGGLQATSVDYANAAYQAMQAGDLKSAKAYMDFAKVTAEFEKNMGGAGGSGGLNSTASGVIADTKTGLASLQNLSQNISKNGANSPIIGDIRAKNPWDTTAQSLQADIATTRQIVGKALEGGVLRKEDEVKYKKILPTVGDTDAVAQYKIQALINLISSRLGEYQNSLTGGTGGTDLAALGL